MKSIKYDSVVLIICFAKLLDGFHRNDDPKTGESLQNFMLAVDLGKKVVQELELSWALLAFLFYRFISFEWFLKRTLNFRTVGPIYQIYNISASKFLSENLSTQTPFLSNH